MVASAATYAHRRMRSFALDLTTAKLLINSTISMPGAIFLGINLANFYLNTPMLDPKYMYMRLCLDIIPNKIIVKYNLHDLVDKEWLGIH